jgi:GDPmannose 4,6-dehydratase
MKKAFVSGISGQDGAWLAKCLIENGYKVYGGIRRNSARNFDRLIYLKLTDKIEFVDFDLLDYSNIFNIVKDIKPDEFYNLAAQSFVGISFKQPISTYQIDLMGVAYILDILKTISPETKFYQASSSEMFGKVNKDLLPYDESCPFYPRSPYGIAKLASHWMTVNYRESYKMFCCSGILFNHESELRGPEFVTRKITMNVAERYRLGNSGFATVLELGNLDSMRDWGYAKEYCEGMFQMMQQPTSDTYILSTGRTTSVRSFVEAAFGHIDRDIKWVGEKENEKGYDQTGELLVQINPKFYRPADVDLLLGHSSKAKKIFGWEAKTDIEKLTDIMVKYDIDNI